VKSRRSKNERGKEMTTQEKLERIKLRGTLYEMVATLPNESRYLAGYCNHGKMNILKMLQKNGEEWAKRIGEKDMITFDKGGRIADMGNIKISFSGRTQREAIIAGELPWFKNIPELQS